MVEPNLVDEVFCHICAQTSEKDTMLLCDLCGIGTVHVALSQASLASFGSDCGYIPFTASALLQRRCRAPCQASRLDK